jgi:hypothetical protein
MLCVVSEDTDRVTGERRLATLRGRLSQPSTPVAVCGVPTGLDCDEPRWRR